MSKVIAAAVLVAVLAAGLIFAARVGFLPSVDRWAEAKERTAQIEAQAAAQIAALNAQRDVALAGYRATEAGVRELGETLRLVIMGGLALIAGACFGAAWWGWSGMQRGVVTVRVRRRAEAVVRCGGL